MGSSMSYLLGLGSVPKLYYAPKPAIVGLRPKHTGEAAAAAEQVTLEELVETRCPSLHDVFAQAWWLPGSAFSYSTMPPDSC